MNLSDSSSERKERHKLLILVAVTVVITAITYNYLHGNQISLASLTKVELIKDTSLMSGQTYSVPKIDSSELRNADMSVVSDLELSWGSDRVNIKQALDNIAGVEGNVTWSIDYDSDKIKNNPDLFIASGNAVNTSRKKLKTFKMLLLVNRETKQFKVLKATDNGEEVSGAMLIMSLALSGGYTTGSNLQTQF